MIEVQLKKSEGGFTILPSSFFHPAWKLAYSPGLLLLVIAVFVTACSNQKSPIHIVKVSLPNYCDDTPTTSVPILVGGQMQESVAFAKTKKATVAQQYSAWFKNNGWSPMTASEDVNALEEMYSKDKVQITMSYSASRGMAFFGSRPEADYKAAPEPGK